MSNQPPSNHKNWLYFAFGSGTVLLLGSIAFLLFLNKSAQSQSAGTWKVEANGTPAGTSSVTIIISSEGKITALSPTKEKEAIELGTITRVSDVAVLPKDTQVLPNPFAYFNNQGKKSRQSEAKTYTGAINRGQQAHYLEKERWAKNLDELAIGIAAESDNYRYKTQPIDAIKTANIKNYPGIAVQTTVAKKEGLKSYLGVSYLSGASSNDLTTLAILCESNEPTTKEAGLPKFDGKAVQCPDGYTNTNLNN
jgi:hypothetical protein